MFSQLTYKRTKVDGSSDSLSRQFEDQIMRLRQDLAAAKNACLKAKLDCEYHKSESLKSVKVVEADLQSVTQQLRAAQKQLTDVRQELHKEKLDRLDEREQLSDLRKRLREKEQSVAPVLLVFGIQSCLVQEAAGFKPGASRERSQSMSKPLVETVSDSKRVSRDDVQSKTDGESLSRALTPTAKTSSLVLIHNLKMESTGMNASLDPNESAVLPVDEDMLLQAEAERKLEAVLKVEIRPEALAEISNKNSKSEEVSDMV
ncbi:hypothetical protein HKX48_002909 [Thoreauomyces humboldtii]|nr:hypothetical protein HKX48_002909 [Thoreauomyces humboldtii]